MNSGQSFDVAMPSVFFIFGFTCIATKISHETISFSGRMPLLSTLNLTWTRVAGSNEVEESSFDFGKRVLVENGSGEN